MRPRQEDPRLSEAEKRRLAKRMDCSPEELLGRIRRFDDQERVSELSTAIVNSIQKESEGIQEEIDDGKQFTDQEIENRLLAAWCVGRIKASMQVDEEVETTADATESEPTSLADDGAEPVAGQFDVDSVVDEINKAVKAEMEAIEQEITEGADIGDTEIRVRVREVLSRLK